MVPTGPEVRVNGIAPGPILWPEGGIDESIKDEIVSKTMLKRSGTYYLFYSGNDYRSQTYAVGYAVCKSAVGPCVKAAENPILATGNASSSAQGPGHQAIAKIGGEYWMLFHGWDGAVGYNRGGSRVMWVQPLSWQDGKPSVGTQAQ